MLGLSFSKLLLIGVVVWFAWRGLRIMGQMQRKLDEHQARQGQGQKPQQPRPQARVRATDLVECPRCGTYVPNGTICPSVEQCQFRRS